MGDDFIGSKPGLDRLLSLVLLVATIAVYWRVHNCSFIYFDDPYYVIDNMHVQAGLTKEGVIWALTTFSYYNWHPMTWLSLMLDFQLYGLNPAGYHLTNLIIHAINGLLLFLVMQEATGEIWQSFMVAALFSLHPLHVESVAWISERKDVLSTLFWMLATLSYIRYTKHTSWRNYFLVFSLMTVGLMAKPMLVTLPFVLLLLDYWPLKRLRIPRFIGSTDVYDSCLNKSRVTITNRFIFLEKIPLLILSIASSVITYIAQAEGGAVQSLELFPLHQRFANALLSYVLYIYKTIFPYDLSIFYPHPGYSLELWHAVASGIIIISIFALAIWQFVARPYFFVGCCWFFGTLVPVIGVVQVGSQGMADRYSYVPITGVFIACVWGFSDLFSRLKINRALPFLISGIILLIFAGQTALQLGYWRDTVTVFGHALDVVGEDGAIHYVLYQAESGFGNQEKSRFHYARALDLSPRLVAKMCNKKGYYLAEQGKFDEAIAQFHEALRIWPGYVSALNNIGIVLARQGRMAEVIAHFTEVLRYFPNDKNALEYLEKAKRQGP